MPNVRIYNVVPYLPENLLPLKEIAYNLWWSWQSDAIQLFQRTDQHLWEITHHNPVKMLGMISQSRLEELANDDSYIANLQRVRAEFESYMSKSMWYQKHADADGSMEPIAYFSAEYGLHESIPNYSGGLGVLSGDHLKSASDLGLPLVAIGLAYHKGYFRQYLTTEGWQQENYPDNDFYNMPMVLERDEEGNPLLVDVDLPGRKVYAQIWKVQVGRVPLYLLDANIPQNSEDDRQITALLYGGDKEMRIKQEILLGIGGVRALRLLGIDAKSFHINEGHCSFLALERIRSFMQQDSLSYAEARELVLASTLFTTHTPVPAGIDVFPLDLVERYFHEYHQQLGLSCEQFLSLGQSSAGEPFNMAVLALRLAGMANGVSVLHGKTSRRMWKNLWPGLPEQEIPIDSVTNGVHIASWTSNEMQQLLNRYLGPRWKEGTSGEQNTIIWKRASDIPDEELWRTHERRRERLVAFARKRLQEQLIRRGATRVEINRAKEVLNPDALTIGFARRFATYKRAILLLRDPERLIRLLTDRDRPIQLIFAGKAHPHDTEGKEFIRQLVQFARQEQVRRHFVFLEDYDINVARYLVQGVDVWLNTPRRPLEASGTSGMKVPVNGGINVAVLDGWWCEGYNPEVGWAIGSGEEYEDTEYQDELESRILFELLEKEIVPQFYDRSEDGLPRDWIARMKAGMEQLCPQFNTHRMVREYTGKFYLRGIRNHEMLMAADAERLKDLASWRQRIEKHWKDVVVLNVSADMPKLLQVGSVFKVSARIALGELRPHEVAVEVYSGQLDSREEIVWGKPSPMVHITDEGGGVHLFEGNVRCDTTGKHGFSVRVLPFHENNPRPEPGFVVWG